MPALAVALDRAQAAGSAPRAARPARERRTTARAGSSRAPRRINDVSAHEHTLAEALDLHALEPQRLRQAGNTELARGGRGRSTEPQRRDFNLGARRQT